MTRTLVTGVGTAIWMMAGHLTIETICYEQRAPRDIESAKWASDGESSLAETLLADIKVSISHLSSWSKIVLECLYSNRSLLA